MYIQIIIGSIRQGRVAKPVGDWAYQVASKRDDLSVELIDLKQWDLPMFDFSKPPIIGDYEDPLQRRWAEKIAQGDAYLFVSPEYNHGNTPSLKNALDTSIGNGFASRQASFLMAVLMAHAASNSCDWC